VSEPTKETCFDGYMRDTAVYYSKQPVSFFDSVQGAESNLRDDDTSGTNELGATAVDLS